MVQYLPFDAANAVIPGISAGGPGGGGGLGGPALEPTTALLVIGAWLIGSLVVATLFTERAEISG